MYLRVFYSTRWTLFGWNRCKSWFATCTYMIYHSYLIIHSPYFTLRDLLLEILSIIAVGGGGEAFMAQRPYVPFGNRQIHESVHLYTPA
ncbi:hypothetical protein OH77DRAFT_70550 [Trametes cingulata]|nr:hypothetical protein OH77DRAFT_70550 [Trametes cingulata]